MISSTSPRNPIRVWTHRVRMASYIVTVFVFLACLFISRQMSLAQGTGTPSGAAGGTSPVAPSPKSSAADDSLLEIVFSGGILGILIMVTLIALSVVAVYLVFDQAMGLRKKDLLPADLVEGVKQLLTQGKLKEADQLCRDRPCPLSFVLASGISEIEFGWPAVERRSRIRRQSKPLDCIVSWSTCL